MSTDTTYFEETTLAVGVRGRIALPKDLLQHLGIEAGSRIAVHKRPNGRIEIQAARSVGKISDVFGALKREGQRPISIDEMNETIAKGWASEL